MIQNQNNKVNSMLNQKLKKIKQGNNRPHGKVNLDNQDNFIIELNNVNKYYIQGNNVYHVLNNVNLSIEKGKFVVIYGASGSGKTTLLNIISGLDRATEGQVIVSNTNLSALKDYKLTLFRRKHLGFIFQSYNLLPDLNAHDNAKIGQVLQPNKQKSISIKQLFEDMEIGHLLKQDIRNLSGGQQQRVSIARALSKNPSLIFADEPTGALDSVSTKKVINLLKEINLKYQTTLIIVTHDREWMKVADQILQVQDGNVRVLENFDSSNQKPSDILEQEVLNQTEVLNETVN